MDDASTTADSSVDEWKVQQRADRRIAGGPWKAKAVLASDTATTRAVAVATAVTGSPPRPERLGARLIMVRPVGVVGGWRLCMRLCRQSGSGEESAVDGERGEGRGEGIRDYRMSQFSRKRNIDTLTLAPPAPLQPLSAPVGI